MEHRPLGRSGLNVSVLGFGCGAVGGLMVRGTPAEQERAVAHALALGINYFDTAADYGSGESERNLGRVLRTLKARPLVGTKVRLPQVARGEIAGSVTAALNASLSRLGMESVDLYQLHNPITADGVASTLAPEVVLNDVLPALRELQRQGKCRHVGITGIGDAIALRRVVDAGGIASAQIPFNLLNPSADGAVPAGFPGQDMGRLMRHCQTAGAGVIGIRILAAGTLSGSMERHPTGMADVPPIISGRDYAADVAQAQRFRALVEEGHAGSLVEAAIRFAISSPAMSTALVGMSTFEQFDTAARAVMLGPLSAAALARVAELQRAMAG